MSQAVDLFQAQSYRIEGSLGHAILVQLVGHLAIFVTTAKAHLTFALFAHVFVVIDIFEVLPSIVKLQDLVNRVHAGHDGGAE